MSGGRAVRAAPGRGNPDQRSVPAVTASHSLTLWSGSLWRIQQALRAKGHGAVLIRFPTPRSPSVRESRLRGRTADNKCGRRVSRSNPQLESRLEQRAVAAHRAYIVAFINWERLNHQLSCSNCRPAGTSPHTLVGRCRTAEVKKERLRQRFRDLCEQLGFLPAGLGVRLPPEHEGCPAKPTFN